MKNFNTADGLAMSSLLCGFKDSKGNLWFGTNGNGVSMYNGKSFITFSSGFGLIHNYIHNVTEDSDGNIWFGTYGGASKYDGVHFYNYTTEDGLIDNDVHEILEDSKGNLWFATIKGVSKYDKNVRQFTNYGSSTGLKDIFMDDILETKNGDIWFSGRGGVYCYDPAIDIAGGEAFVDLSDILKLQGVGVNEMLEDAEGIIWIATERFVGRFDPSTGEVRHYDKNDGLIDNYIFSCTEDSNGNIWFGTKGGASKFSKTTGTFMNLTKENGLADNTIRNITLDKSGSLWFGTYGGGLNKLGGETVVEYKIKNGPSWKAVYAVLEDQNANIWFAPSDGGIVKLERALEPGQKNRFTAFTTKQGLPDNTFLNIVEDHDGNLWFASDEGLCRYDGEYFTTFTEEQGLPDTDVTSLTVDSNGDLWIGTFEGGVSMFDGKAFKNFGVLQGLAHKTVWDILQDKDGVIWIATRGGLSRYDGKRVMNFYEEQGLTDNKLSRVFQDSRGNLLVGSWGGGLMVIRKERLQKFEFEDLFQNDDSIFENFTTTQGLSNDVVYTILEDDDKNIVLGTNRGFTLLKAGIKPDSPIGDSGIENFNERTGYAIKDISNNFSMVKDRDGNFWLGTGDKFLKFNYSNILKDTIPPPLFLENLKIRNENISWHSVAWARNEEKPVQEDRTAAFKTNELLVFNKELDKKERDTMIDSFQKVRFSGILPFYPVPVELSLPYSQNDIEIEFLGVETSRPSMVQYQYKLEGYDETWSPASSTGLASYGNLPEGEYNFVVKARNPQGVWSKPVDYAFEVRPPWYRSWYAYITYVLLFLILLYFVDKYQKKRVLLKERQKAMKRELVQAHKIEEAYKELKATQAQLIHAEKMASFGELTAGIAHEIQNPLNFVTNFSDVSKDLIEEVGEELGKGNLEDVKLIMEDIRQNLELITSHGKRADAIVKGMLQHSRSSTGQKEPVDLNKLVEDSLRLAYHGFRNKNKSFSIEITKDYDRNLKSVLAVPQDLGRVLINLLTNAFHAVLAKKSNGELYNDSYQPLISVQTRGVGAEAVVSVSDNGTGIPEHIRDKIFQPFFSTKPSGEGTGLGLSLSSDIVKTHGGELFFETEIGSGSTFNIQLPLVGEVQREKP
ncbi:two-component regulator propeller domain-containing protein [Salinimicrobium sp. CAU 1759]